MELEKKSFVSYCQGKTIMDQFYLDEDINVPDLKMDVQRIVLDEGKIQIDDMKRVENYIRVTGKLLYKILYVTDEGERRIASLEGKLLFEEMVYTEEEPFENMFVKSKDAEITVTVIHSRKLNLKAVVELQVCSDGQKEMELLMDVYDQTSLYKRYREESVLQLVSMKKDTYRIKEEVVIGGTKETIGALLWTEVVGRKLDTRISQDEVLLQGELVCFCLYESIDGKTDWIEQTISYQGKINCYGINDQMYHQIYPELGDVMVDVRMDEDGEMRILGIEATLEMRLIVYEEEKISILDDLYSLEKVCELEQKEKEMKKLLMQNHSKCKMAERLSLPEIKDDILQICHSSARIEIGHTEITNQGIQIEGTLHVHFLYVKSDDAIPFDVWQGMVPFAYLLESNETKADMEYDLLAAVEQLSIGLLGNDEVEIKAVLAFMSFMREVVFVNNIEAISYKPLDAKQCEAAPGIIGYIVKEEDKLWDLAKKYNTTVESIAKVNNLEKMELKTGQKILIFKENMSIL